MTDKQKYTGTIFALNKDRGFGFITSKHADLRFKKIFFHWTALKNDTVEFTELKRGDEVEFETIELEDKGIRAINIDVLEPEGQTEKEKTNDNSRKVVGDLAVGKKD